MKINIVTEPPNGWVLRMMAERWAEYLPDCTITSMIPNQNSDINFSYGLVHLHEISNLFG